MALPAGSFKAKLAYVEGGNIDIDYIRLNPVAR